MGFLSELFGKKKEGPSESYYENGQLKTKATYKDDERDGPLWPGVPRSCCPL